MLFCYLHVVPLGSRVPTQAPEADYSFLPRDILAMLLKSKTLKFVKTQVMHRAPHVYIAATRFAGRHLLFGREKRFLEGKCPSESPHPSVFFFSYNRCASMYISDLIVRLSAADGLVHIDLSRYFFNAHPGTGRARFADPDFVNRTFLPTGYYFGPLRCPVPFHGLGDCRQVLVLRDPRDVLTSRFFSAAYAHSLPDRKFLRDRLRAQEMGIDAFVEERIPEVLEPYQAYVDELLGKSNVLFLRYEDMVADFESWLRRLANHVAGHANEETIGALLAESDFTVDRENPYAHKRSVTPGAHRTKLREETVRRIEEAFAPLMAPLGYAS